MPRQELMKRKLHPAVPTYHLAARGSLPGSIGMLALLRDRRA